MVKGLLRDYRPEKMKCLERGLVMEGLRKVLVLITVIMMFMTVPAAADIPYANRATLHSGYDAECSLTEAQISDLLNAAFSMPTGGNQRALEFFVVTDRKTLSEMKGGNPYSQALDTAPCVIVITADTDSAFYEELLEMDAGIAAGAILLQAADFNLSTCVLSIAPQQERIRSVRSALGMDENLLPVLMIAVGYPSTDAVSGASVSNWEESRVNWNR